MDFMNFLSSHWVEIGTAMTWCLGGFLSGVCAMGAALFAVPVTALFLPMQDAILISCMTLPFMDMAMSLFHMHFCRWKALIPLLLASVPGYIDGLWVIANCPDRVLNLIVGIALLVFPFYTMHVHIESREENWKAASIAGFTAGVLGTSISFDGPPVGAYAVYAGWQPRVILGTLGVFWVVRGAFSWILQGASGLYTPHLLYLACWSIPATVLGLTIAYPISTRISAEAMRRLLLILLFLCGISCLVKAARQFGLF